MASWVKWESGLERKPEVLAMAAALNVDRFAVAGRLMAIWSWADETTKNGRLAGDMREQIDDMVSKENFANSMIGVGWLRVTDGVTVFPHWKRHNLQTSKTRALAAARQARKRWRDSHASSVTTSVTNHDATIRYDTIPIPKNVSKEIDRSVQADAISEPGSNDGDWKLDRETWASACYAKAGNIILKRCPSIRRKQIESFIPQLRLVAGLPDRDTCARLWCEQIALAAAAADTRDIVRASQSALTKLLKEKGLK